jgi:hypothetical protein
MLFFVELLAMLCVISATEVLIAAGNFQQGESARFQLGGRGHGAAELVLLGLKRRNSSLEKMPSTPGWSVLNKYGRICPYAVRVLSGSAMGRLNWSCPSVTTWNWTRIVEERSHEVDSGEIKPAAVGEESREQRPESERQVRNGALVQAHVGVRQGHIRLPSAARARVTRKGGVRIALEESY